MKTLIILIFSGLLLWGCESDDDLCNCRFSAELNAYIPEPFFPQDDEVNADFYTRKQLEDFDAQCREFCE
ncbi:hypothetical protein [Robertkochia aurantiaca]|uniref:hypothetical protein n=1 Tax=Robertkochia aurantiaca TaxID=2873700 RepID=UPI001CCE07C3|nr:hypothetical protein [Robertkochia sp. 3YJGBD-33]